MIQRLPYAAAYAYSPRGRSDLSVRSRTVRNAIKSANPEALAAVATRVSSWSEQEFEGFFGPDVTLVPIPGRAPMRSTDSLWVPERICRALVRQGLGREIWTALERTHVVPKSAFSAPGERPELQVHIDSLRVTSRIPPSGNVLLVDDFVTKGRTLLASAIVLSEALPSLQIRAFAVVRTMGLIPDIEKIQWPVVGEIRAQGADAFRDP